MTSRYPLILDGNNTATRLLIQHTHELNGRCGPEQTRNIRMEYYWILRCRAVVKQTIRHCHSRRRTIQDVSIPKMADLPQERLPKKINSSSKQLDLILLDRFLLRTMASCLVVTYYYSHV